jgi:hypothetical protein
MNKDLERFVEDRSKLRKNRAATNATTFVMLDLRHWDTHSVHFPVDVADRSRDPSLTGSTDQVA